MSDPVPARSLSLATVVVVFLYGCARILDGVLPPAAHVYLVAARDVLALALALLPAAWGRSSPPTLPVSAETAAKVGLVLAFLAPAVALALPVPGVALAPGPLEIAAEAVRPQLPPIPRQPMIYAADLAPLQVSPVLVALLAPDAPAVPVVASDPAPAPTHAGEVAAVVRGAAAAVEAAKASPVPPGFWQSKTGQVLGVTLNVATVVTSAALAFASVYAAVR